MTDTPVPAAKAASASASASASAPAPKADTNKVLVRTTGEFMLMDTLTREEIDPGVEKLMTKSQFIERRLAVGDLELVK